MTEGTWTIPKSSIRNRKAMKQFRKIFFTLGTLCVIYGIGVIAIIGMQHWFDFFGIITGVGSISVALLAPFFKNFSKGARHVFFLCLVFVFSIFALTEIFIITEGQRLPVDNAEYIIVLGAKVEGTNPSFALARRIEATADYMLENPDTIALATGGRGSDERISEGNAIANGLFSLGIEPSRVLVEDESTSTKENLLNGLYIIEENGGSANSKIVIVSSEYHVFRAKKLAESIGYRNISTKGSPSMLYLNPHYYAREFAALAKEKLDGNI